VTRDEYYAAYGSRFPQASERLFFDEFLWPLLGERIDAFVPQHPFIDSTGRSRRIDFAHVQGRTKIALEVNGETYHAEGIVPNETFDDNLFRQNEILRDGYELIRFSYNMLQSAAWRPVVMESLRSFLTTHAPTLLGSDPVKPNPLQRAALEALEFYRGKGYRKGVVILPTGTGKTILSALDAKRSGTKTLFLVHRLDILKQSIDAYRKVWPEVRVGQLTGEVRENEEDCDVLFASKDTLRQPAELGRFKRDHFGYVVVDEVHHGSAPSYSEVLAHFQPEFMLGMTATPERKDRKDILELFDYNKVFEVSLQEAIEERYLVPYTYYGLFDDIDYSKIRFQNHRYRVDDLERALIIPERNAAILREYLAKGSGDKAIGFCVSVRHAERMAEYFREHGVSAAAITGESTTREADIAAFRANELAVAFTVELFNEGVDFPNVRVLMFLRPTESKTVFLQQLGRGLRLCVGKDRVRVLDFIGNYKRGNQIRKWLAKSATVRIDDSTGRRHKKVEYTYSTGCEVEFDAKVEEILDRLDEEEIPATKDDLKEAYAMLGETLGRKPSRADIEREGQYELPLYTRLFGSWREFLQEMGEYTEASYHYPQGVHLGHVLAILDVFGRATRESTAFDDRYIRLRGGLGPERLGAYQRQVKYKLLAAMELGLIVDDRTLGASEVYRAELTPLGRDLRAALLPVLSSLDLDFEVGEDGIPGTRMRLSEREYNAAIRDFITSNDAARRLFRGTILSMTAAQQMLRYLLEIARKSPVQRAAIYTDFFSAPFVKQFCDQEGIEEATEESARHRCPFLLNLLEACGFVSLARKDVEIQAFVIAAPTVRSHRREHMEDAERRAKALLEAWPANPAALESEDVSILKELFGPSFLTPEYFLTTTEYVELLR
jgi:superfamily II DNA or RNA helicase